MEHLLAIGEYVISHPLGIFLAILVSYAVGFLWHGPLFGKPWMKANKISPPKPEDVKFSMMAPGLTANFFLVLAQSAVLGRTFQIVSLTGLGQALLIATIIWLPFTALVIVNIYAWVGRPVMAMVLDCAHALVALWAVAAVLYVTL